MSRAWLLGLLASCALVAGFASLRGGELVLAVPFLIFLAYAILRAPPAVQLEIHRQVSAERVAAGAPVQVTLSIANIGPGLEELTLLDTVPAGLSVVDGSPHHFITLPAGSTYEFKYTARGPRGGYTFGPLRTRGCDSLGLLETAANWPAPGNLVVLPAISRVKAIPIRPRRTRVYAGSIPARVGGEGVEFFGLRQYEFGDSARRINWRATARHPEAVFANEFQQERVADVAVVLDGRERVDLRTDHASLFEYSVVAAGSLASVMLREGNRVGLLVYSQYIQWTFHGYGRIQRERILRSLASAAPGGSQIFDGLQHLPTRLFPPESQIVLVSPLLDDDLPALLQLRARGYQVLVVCPDPVAFEAAVLDQDRNGLSRAEILLASRIVRLERATSFARLRRAGVQVVEWDVAETFDNAMRGAFHRVGGRMTTA